MNKITNIKERILYLAKSKGFSIEDFCSKIGMTYGNFKGKHKETPINSNTLVTILTIIPDVNALWLLTGNGEMINESINDISNLNSGTGTGTEKNLLYKELVTEKDKEIALLNREIGKLQLEIELIKQHHFTGYNDAAEPSNKYNKKKH